MAKVINFKTLIDKFIYKFIAEYNEEYICSKATYINVILEDGKKMYDNIILQSKYEIDSHVNEKISILDAAQQKYIRLFVNVIYSVLVEGKADVNLIERL